MFLLSQAMPTNLTRRASIAKASPFNWLSLGLFAIAPTISLCLAPGWPNMLASCFLIFATLKYLVWPIYSSNHVGATARDQFEFYFLWPGFDVEAFLGRSVARVRKRSAEWLAAFLKISIGALLFWGVMPIFFKADPWLLGTAGMLSAILLIHCGVFHVVALAWQVAGRRVVPIMNRPLEATSLSDFWSNRWNLAFRDAAAQLVFRPAARHLGVTSAMLLTFLFSGVIHDVAISLPARGGYGLPTLYFLLQGVGVVGQRALLERLDGKWKLYVGRFTTLAVVIGPMPLLFHRPFAEHVVVPLMYALGAI